jgi:hypothetical protein
MKQPTTASTKGNSVAFESGEIFVIGFGGADIAIDYEHCHTDNIHARSNTTSTLQVLSIWLF